MLKMERKHSQFYKSDRSDKKRDDRRLGRRDSSASRSYSRSQSRRSGYSRSRKHSSEREEIDRVERIKEDVAKVVRERELDTQKFYKDCRSKGKGKGMIYDRDFEDILTRDIKFKGTQKEIDLLCEHYGKKVKRGYIDYKTFDEDIYSINKRTRRRSERKAPVRTGSKDGSRRGSINLKPKGSHIERRNSRTSSIGKNSERSNTRSRKRTDSIRKPREEEKERSRRGSTHRKETDDEEYRSKRHDDRHRSKRDDEEHRSRKDDDRHRSKRDDDRHRSRRDDDRYKSHKDDDRHRSKRDDERHRSRKDDDRHRSRRDDERHRSRKDDNRHRSRRDDERHKSRRDDDRHRSRRDSNSQKSRDEPRIKEIGFSYRISPNMPDDGKYSMKNTVIGKYPDKRKQRKHIVKISDYFLQDMIKATYTRNKLVGDAFRKFSSGRDGYLSESAFKDAILTFGIKLDSRGIRETYRKLRGQEKELTDELVDIAIEDNAKNGIEEIQKSIMEKINREIKKKEGSSVKDAFLLSERTRDEEVTFNDFKKVIKDYAPNVKSIDIIFLAKRYCIKNDDCVMYEKFLDDIDLLDKGINPLISWADDLSKTIVKATLAQNTDFETLFKKHAPRQEFITKSQFIDAMASINVTSKFDSAKILKFYYFIDDDKSGEVSFREMESIIKTH